MKSSKAARLVAMAAAAAAAVVVVVDMAAGVVATRTKGTTEITTTRTTATATPTPLRLGPAQRHRRLHRLLPLRRPPTMLPNMRSIMGAPIPMLPTVATRPTLKCISNGWPRKPARQGLLPPVRVLLRPHHRRHRRARLHRRRLLLLRPPRRHLHLDRRAPVDTVRYVWFLERPMCHY